MLGLVAGRLTKHATLAAAAAAAIAPAAALGAPVEVTAFSLSPSCSHPGGTVTANDTVQTTTTQNQTMYVQTQALYYGKPVATQRYGPFITGPYSTIYTSTPTDVPWYAPLGTYTVVFSIGPSADDPTSWSSRSAELTLKPWPIC